jgi:hypothetical protein
MRPWSLDAARACCSKCRRSSGSYGEPASQTFAGCSIARIVPSIRPPRSRSHNAPGGWRDRVLIELEMLLQVCSELASASVSLIAERKATHAVRHRTAKLRCSTEPIRRSAHWAPANSLGAPAQKCARAKCLFGLKLCMRMPAAQSYQSASLASLTASSEVTPRPFSNGSICSS